MSSPERNLSPDEITRLLARDGNDISALYDLVTDLRTDMKAGFEASATRDADLGRKLDLILTRLGGQ